MPEKPSQEPPSRTFEENANVGLVREFWEFLRTNKLWWMTPIIVVALLLAGVVILGSTPAAPFIYTLF